MFRSFIYLDSEKLYSYKRLLEGLNSPIQKTFNKKQTKSISASLSGIGMSSLCEENIASVIEKDVSFDYDKFEHLLEKYEGSEFFDFIIDGDDYDLGSIPSMKIIRIQGYMEIPESFDILNVIEQFKPLLLSSISSDSSNSSAEEAAKNLLSNAKADIPIIIDTGDISVCSKLNTTYLKNDYTQLEDYAEQEVTFLCKVEGLTKGGMVTVYNPMKDFIKLNRAMRRASNLEENEQLRPIQIEGPVLKTEIIAIYK